MHNASQPETEQKFLTRRSLAARWDVHYDTVRQMERKGRLTPRREVCQAIVRYAMEEILAVESSAKK